MNGMKGKKSGKQLGYPIKSVGVNEIFEARNSSSCQSKISCVGVRCAGAIKMQTELAKTTVGNIARSI